MLDVKLVLLVYCHPW